MSWYWWLLIVYGIGFVPVFLFNMAIGPVTFGLALLRAIVWPLYVITGWPRGYVQPFD